MEYMEYLQLKEGTPHGDFLSPLSYYELNRDGGTFVLPLHWHEEIEITYIDRGEGTYAVDLEEFSVKDGDFVVVSPKALHSSYLNHPKGIRTLTFVFHLNMLNSLLTDACGIKFFAPLMHGEFSTPIVIHKDTPGYFEILETFFKLHDAYKEKTVGYELAVKSHLMFLFYQMFHHNIFQKKGGQLPVQHTAELLKKVINYIHTSYAKHITVADLASLCDFSEYHFMRFFKNHVGMTCIDYINNYRLDIPAAMLKDREASVMEIALDTGFHNISYFNKVFKAKFHMTPSQYRKLITEIGT